MKIKLQTFKFTFLALSLLTSAAEAQSQVSQTWERGQGQISGILTNGKKVRLLNLDAQVVQNFELSGPFLQGQKIRQWKDSCKHFAANPKMLNSSKEALFMSSEALPFTTEKIAEILGYPLETEVEVLSVRPEILLNEKSYTLKANKYVEPKQVVALLQNKMKVDMGQVKAGRPLTVDITGEGAFSCDLVLGNAALRFVVEVRHQYAMPDIFMPIRASDLEALSKVLVANYAWSGNVQENTAVAGAIVLDELRNFGINGINYRDDIPGRAFWNASTLSQIVLALLDQKTGKTKILSSAEAEKLAEKLKVTTYTIRETELILDADFSGGLK